MDTWVHLRLYLWARPLKLIWAYTWAGELKHIPSTHTLYTGAGELTNTCMHTEIGGHVSSHMYTLLHTRTRKRTRLCRNVAPYRVDVHLPDQNFAKKKKNFKEEETEEEKRKKKEKWCVLSCVSPPTHPFQPWYNPQRLTGHITPTN